MNQGPRIFLSHSTKEELPKTIRDRIASALRKDDKFRVLLDKGGLAAGVGWRNSLELWIGSCDAAVVLLSEAALESTFVAHEVSVLSYRQRHQKQTPFVLVPVFIAPVSYSAIRKSPIAASFLTEIEPVRIDPDAGSTLATDRWFTPDDGIREVVERLEDTVKAPTPLDDKLRELTDLLENVPTGQLERVAEDLGVYFEETWLPHAEGDRRRLPRKVACALMGSPLERAKTALYTVRDYLRAPHHGAPSAAVCQALDLAASSWVSAVSADQIRRGVTAGATTVCADCSRPLTAQMYVDRACTQPLTADNRWPVGQVDGMVGEGTDKELEDLVRSELARLLGLEAPSEVAEELEFYRHEAVLQVFVTLPVTCLAETTLAHLRTTFPGVSFFLLTGQDELASGPLERAGVTVLRPPGKGKIEHPDYPPLDEEELERTYRAAHRLVTRRRT